MSVTQDDVIDWNDFFVGDNSNIKTTHCTQDHIHIATKLRTRLLKPSIILPMGKHFVSPTDVKSLIEEVGKDEHQLTLTDLDSSGKINYRAIEKIWRPEVLSLLDEHIPDSKATVSYLEACQLAVFSFIDKELTPIQRISDMWYSISFFRLWIKWLQDSGFSTTKIFISANTYACLEINGHALIQTMRHLRDNDEENLFLPWLWDSQTCEAFFRAARSMISTYSTVVNFSILELVWKTRRIDFQGAEKQKLNKTYTFPNSRRVSAIDKNCSMVDSNTCVKLPTNRKILQAITAAHKKAFIKCEALGLVVSSTLPKPVLTSAIYEKLMKEKHEARCEMSNDTPDESDNDDSESQYIDVTLNNQTSSTSVAMERNKNDREEEEQLEEDLCVLETIDLDPKSFIDSDTNNKLSTTSQFVEGFNAKGKKKL